MNPKKHISKRGVSDDPERSELLALMTTPCRSPKCQFQAEGHFVCELSSAKRSEYEAWCKEFLDASVDNHSTAPSQAILALRQLLQENVPLPCTIQAIRDFVFYDLTASRVVPDALICKNAMKLSSKRVDTLMAKCGELQNKQMEEMYSFTKRVSSPVLFQDKINLCMQIAASLNALQEIYRHEVEILEQVNADSFSRAQAVHLMWALPPQISCNGRRYWKELATLMNTARHVWQNGIAKLKGVSRTYTEDAIEKLVERFTADDLRKLREELEAGIPHGLSVVVDLKEQTLLEMIAMGLAFTPSDQCQVTKKSARSLRDALKQLESLAPKQ